MIIVSITHTIVPLTGYICNLTKFIFSLDCEKSLGFPCFDIWQVNNKYKKTGWILAFPKDKIFTQTVKWSRVRVHQSLVGFIWYATIKTISINDPWHVASEGLKYSCKAEGQSQGKISTNAPKTQCQSNLSSFHFDTIHRNSLAVWVATRQIWKWHPVNYYRNMHNLYHFFFLREQKWHGLVEKYFSHYNPDGRFVDSKMKK